MAINKKLASLFKHGIIFFKNQRAEWSSSLNKLQISASSKLKMEATWEITRKIYPTIRTLALLLKGTLNSQGTTLAPSPNSKNLTTEKQIRPL